MITTEDYNSLSINEYSGFYNNIYLGESNGRGVFAKTSFKKNQIIEIAPFILDKSVTGFADYIFGSHIENYAAVLVLGYGSIYNHSEKPNVKYFYTNDDLTKSNPLQNFIVYYAARDIDINEELKISYGRTWWTERQLTPRS